MKFSRKEVKKMHFSILAVFGVIFGICAFFVFWHERHRYAKIGFAAPYGTAAFWCNITPWRDIPRTKKIIVMIFSCMSAVSLTLLLVFALAHQRVSYEPRTVVYELVERETISNYPRFFRCVDEYGEPRGFGIQEGSDTVLFNYGVEDPVNGWDNYVVVTMTDSCAQWWFIKGDYSTEYRYEAYLSSHRIPEN